MKRVDISNTIVSRTCSDTAAKACDHVLIMCGVRVSVWEAWLKACGDLWNVPLDTVTSSWFWPGSRCWGGTFRRPRGLRLRFPPHGDRTRATTPGRRSPGPLGTSGEIDLAPHSVITEWCGIRVNIAHRPRSPQELQQQSRSSGVVLTS